MTIGSFFDGNKIDRLSDLGANCPFPPKFLSAVHSFQVTITFFGEQGDEIDIGIYKN